MKNFALAGALMLAATSSLAQQIAMKTDNGVQWTCGGVGVEERHAIAALEPQANVKLLLVTQKRGGYLADVEVQLFERNATAPRLRFTADGPICLLRLPAGSYRVEGAFQGVTRRAQVSAPAEVGHPARVVLAFPGEPWDGIWASTEEKQQGRE